MEQNTTISLPALEDRWLLSHPTEWDARIVVTVLSAILFVTALSGKHSNVISYVPRGISRRISSWKYLLDGPRIIQDEFGKVRYTLG